MRVRKSKLRKRRSKLQTEKRLRSFEALSLWRSGKAKSASAAVDRAGITLVALRDEVPAAIAQDRPGGRIRIKASDRYSAKVQILTDEGAITTTARGSRQRELAGQHRATYTRVLQGVEPKTALERYRGKKVGGHELLSDYEQLRLFARAGILGQLDPLYVSPDVSV
jgi:hypothetical protein